VIIEIKDDGNGAWNLVARTGPDDWPPLYMAYSRSPWAIKALVGGILSDFDEPTDGRTERQDQIAEETL
jgi:hypothetical protein